MTIVRSAGESGSAAARCCAAAEWHASASLLKRDRDAWVLAGDSPVGPLVVKSMVLDRPLDAVKRLLGATRLLREWRGSEALRAHGFIVARPLALWRTRDERGRVIESLAMGRLPGETLLRHIADRDLSPEVESALARRLGEDLARLARLGLVNTDHKPSNLLVLPGSTTEIAILDTAGIRRSNPRAALVRMLFALIVEPIGCGLRVPIALRLTTLRSAVRVASLDPIEAARLWRDVRERLSAHGDPTPRINPLAGSASTKREPGHHPHDGPEA